MNDSAMAPSQAMCNMCKEKGARGTARRIAIYVPSLRGGGAERVMVALANSFASRKHKVDIVLAQAEGPYLENVSEAVRIVDLGASRVLFSLPGLVRYLRREQPVAMLSALDHANVVALVARMLARAQTRIVVSVRNTVSVSGANADSLRERNMAFFMRRVYPRADGIAAISNGVADDLAESIGIPRSSIRVIYNPVAIPESLNGDDDRLDHPWFASGMPPVVLGVGRLVPQKDFSLLLNAFALVRAKREARLMILGEGHLRTELEELTSKLGLRNDVLLPGFVNNPCAYMRRAALFVLSSRWEGFGNVLVEAMACGTPVVSVDCRSGPGEILAGGRWGRLTPVGDADDLANAIGAALDDPSPPDVRRRALDFSVERAANAYLSILGMEHS